MAKPIPVFAFAFAAYAATSARMPSEFRGSAGEDRDADELFLSICRAPGRASANFMVKLGLVVDENGRASCLCDRRSAGAGVVEDLWLSQIQDGCDGFSGVVRATPERRIGAVQRISFELRHVLGWKLEAHATGVTSAAPAPVQMLRGESDAAPACSTKKGAGRFPQEGDIRAK